MEGLLILAAIIGAVGVGAFLLYDVSHQHQGGGWGIIWRVAILPVTILASLFKGGRYALESADVSLPAIFGPRRVRNPESVELVKRKTVNPSRPDGAEHGSWPLM